MSPDEDNEEVLAVRSNPFLIEARCCLCHEASSSQSDCRLFGRAESEGVDRVKEECPAAANDGLSLPEIGQSGGVRRRRAAGEDERLNMTSEDELRISATDIVVVAQSKRMKS